MSQQYKDILLISLAALNAKERAERTESDELILQTATFLLQYAFLLEPASEIDNFLKPKNALTGEIHAQNVHAARYLDPKYSRWISVDPALGEYIPAAGKGNSENAGNLPGMGGIYNRINGNLETGFKLVDKYKKTSSTVTPKVYACVSAKQDGIATIDVIIEIDNYYSIFNFILIK